MKSSHTYAFLFVVSCFIQACAGGKLITVLIEDKAGNTELVYRKVQAPNNLVKEIRYYPNGDTLSVTPMLKGAVHGVVTQYQKGNVLKEQVAFQNGVQNGIFRRFDKDGVVVFEGQLKDGEKTGTWTTWYDDVQKQEERTYQNDVPSGKWTYWYIDGALKREEVYENGKLLESNDF